MTTESPSSPTVETGKQADNPPTPNGDVIAHGAALPPPPNVAAANQPAQKWSLKKSLTALVIAALAIVSIVYLWPVVHLAFTTTSTDDAYVNGHVTFVAPRVSGQVLEVLVDDNQRVKKGDVLVRLDPVPYQVSVDVRKAAVVVAQANLMQANAQAHALVAQARAHRFQLEYAMDQVKNQVANLQADVATLNSRKAERDLAKSNLKRGEDLGPGGGGVISQEELDLRRQTVNVDEAQVDEALQKVYSTRASLGLATEPPNGQELGSVPDDLAQNYSSVRQALAELVQSASQLGYFPTDWNATPQQTIDQFYKQDPKRDLNAIYEHLIPNSPQVKQSEAQLLQAKRDLEQAELNLAYCNIVSEIDGVVTRRNVNPGNNVQVGEDLMAVRSLTEIWIDANFKETQLGDLRIGQRVVCEVDMYGRKKEFEGRITGFTMGTGQTLSLLPPQNATGNFVKVVQRLPVRIELTNYDPDKFPLFVGLSVQPRVYINESPQGENAGEFLQDRVTRPQAATNPTPERESTPAKDSSPAEPKS
jgi:membrane fusion protein (multidrug efflux system)